jgi:DNA repair photolyase
MVGITERGDTALNHEWKPWVTEGKPAILITKDPLTLSHQLSATMNIIVHCTITGWGSSPIEPNVPDPATAIEGFKKVQRIIGYERTVLRVDPIITEYSERSIKVIKSLKGTFHRLRISFLDMYPHVAERFTNGGIKIQQKTFHSPLHERQRVLSYIKSIFSDVEICGEPELPCTGCISVKDLAIFNIQVQSNNRSQQRSTCHCLASKRELLSNKQRCKHQCLYCYWK